MTSQSSLAGDGYADFEIDCLYLLPGRYYLSLWLGKWSNQQDVLKNCISFDVEASIASVQGGASRPASG